jgi:hypothetical protein
MTFLRGVALLFVVLTCLATIVFTLCDVFFVSVDLKALRVSRGVCGTTHYKTSWTMTFTSVEDFLQTTGLDRLVDAKGVRAIFSRAGIPSPWMQWGFLTPKRTQFLICLDCLYWFEQTATIVMIERGVFGEVIEGEDFDFDAELDRFLVRRAEIERNCDRRLRCVRLPIRWTG